MNDEQTKERNKNGVTQQFIHIQKRNEYHSTAKEGKIAFPWLHMVTFFQVLFRRVRR